jgi:hypothetical protein
MRPWITAGLVIVLLSNCAGRTATDTTAPPATQAFSASSLIDSLRQSGLTLRDAGTVEQAFFVVPARVYVIDDRDLQIYEFATSAQAQDAARQVAPSGSPIGTTMVTWMADPHFFRKDRLIVNYIGTSDRVLGELQRLLGPQFAGR